MKKFLYFILATFLFIFPLSVKADEICTINEQDGYETLEEAFDAANNGDNIVLIQNYELESDLTIPAGITLSSSTNKITVPAEFTLTVNGTLAISGTGSLDVYGTLDVEGNGVLKINATTTLQSNANLLLKGHATMNIREGILDTKVNSKIQSDNNDGPVVNVYQTETGGRIIGSASFYSLNSVVFNNYGGVISESIKNQINSDNYNYYPLYDEINNKYYKLPDDISAGTTVVLFAPLDINGDSTLVENATINMKGGNRFYVNGNFTLNGTINMNDGYARLVVSGMLGTGTVYLNKATELTTGYTTYVTILNDTSTTVTYEAIEGYDPASGDVVFELGTTEAKAIALAARIKLGNSFDGLVINPTETALAKINGGYALGVLGVEVIDDVIDDEHATNNPNTGNGDLLILGLISLSAIIFSLFCAKRIYILNRI